MSNNNLMIIIIVLLAGIFCAALIQMNQKSPMEEIGDSISETVEEIGDEIDDNTTGGPQ